MIQWSWRLEHGSSIVAGSWRDDTAWEQCLDRLRGTTVEAVRTFGRLPELELELSDGHRILSFMTADGDPQWVIFDRRPERRTWLHVRNGRVEEQEEASRPFGSPASFS